jgi:ribonuclease-3
VLELAIAHALYDRFPDYEEGQMAKLRSQVVSRASCAVIADELGLGARLLEQHPGPEGSEAARLARNRNVLAALLEAALAALYLEHGFAEVAGPIVEAFQPRIEYALTHKVDHKTELQEELARRGRSVNYMLLDSEGPAHERTFTAAAMIDGVQAGVGKGASKKDAEQEAARHALEELTAADAGTSPASGRSE